MWRRMVVAGLGLAAAGAGAVAAGALRARRRFEQGQAATIRLSAASAESAAKRPIAAPPSPAVPAEPAKPSRRRRRPPDADGRPHLSDLADIRAFFRTNETPIYFVSATAFNLLGIDRFVRNFRYVNYYDSFDGGHPNVVVPTEREPRASSRSRTSSTTSSSHKEVRDLVAAAGLAPRSSCSTSRRSGCVRRCGLKIALPSAELRHRLDSKIETTRLGNEAGVPSVPERLGRARSTRRSWKLAATAGLGEDLVVQTPYGDSGKTTFFISPQADWDGERGGASRGGAQGHARIDPRELAIEGVVTRHGTLVGPLMTELTGLPRADARTAAAGAATRSSPIRSTAEHARSRASGHQRMGERLAGGGLSRLLRARLPRRRGDRRALPRRAEPADHRRDRRSRT